jgi:hypothetical protein
MLRFIISWAMMIGGTIGMVISMFAWRKGHINEKQMVGLTLLLSWLALVFSAITTLFVA